MRFSRWLSLDEALAGFPEGPGVFQVRLGDGLLMFPKGRSAMVAYGAGGELRGALRAFLQTDIYARAVGLGPLLFRYAEPEAGRTPEEAVAVLRRRFVDQFGGPPYAEASG